MGRSCWMTQRGEEEAEGTGRQEAGAGGRKEAGRKQSVEDGVLRRWDPSGARATGSHAGTRWQGAGDDVRRRLGHIGNNAGARSIDR